MPAIWNPTLSTASSEFRIGADARPLTVVRSRAARRMRLSVDPRNGTIRLSLPARAGLKAALVWVEAQRPWIERQLGRLPAPRPILPGAEIALGDELLTVDWVADRPRAVRRDGSRLVVGGPEDALSGRVLRWLKREALDVLSRESREFAALAGVEIGRIGVGDPRSRWGSCAAGGDIRYSWRLIMAPAFVRRATVAHEVAHRVHMNHGPAFHALVADLLGSDPAPARQWLRVNGAALHWVGRGS